MGERVGEYAQSPCYVNLRSRHVFFRKVVLVRFVACCKVIAVEDDKLLWYGA